MRFYHATSFIFPRNYAGRMFALCFGAVHLPLVAFLAVEAIRGEWSWPVFITLLLATVLGSAFAIIGLSGMLAPVRVATGVLGKLRDGRHEIDVPRGGEDLAGELLETVAAAVHSTAERISQLESVADTDLLTGLLNRRGFLERLRRVSLEGGALAILDGDGFKRINDEYGHAQGDRALRAMAERLQAHAGPGDLVGRWGGDEFVFFWIGRSRAHAQAELEAINASIASAPIAHVGQGSLRFSYGIAELKGADEATIDSAIAAADATMYRAKQARRAAAE